MSEWHTLFFCEYDKKYFNLAYFSFLYYLCTMKLLGIVILYYPQDSYLLNLNSYISLLDALIVWDNTPQEAKQPLNWSVVKSPEKLIMKGRDCNTGLGTPLNEAITYMRDYDFTHLLALDQDSKFKVGVLEQYLIGVKSCMQQEAIFCPNYFLISQQSAQYPVVDSVDEITSSMTSGSIYPLTVLNRVGEFLDALFVWGIDSEYCFRAKRLGIPTLCFKNILLTHDLGYQKKKRKLLGKEVFPNEYGAARSYYNVRNGILLHRLYPNIINLQDHLRYHLWKRSVFIVLYEQQKLRKLYALFWGYVDGKRNRMGQSTHSL